MKKLILLLLLISSTVLAQGRPFKVITVDPNTGEILDSEEVVDLKNLFNSLVHELREQLENQDRFSLGRIADKVAKFDGQIVRLETLHNSLDDQALKDLVQKRIELVETLRSELTGDQEGGRKDKSDKAPSIISQLNRKLNDVDRALRDAEGG